ncbi:MAG: 1-(5-phosphoribosyl)-5-amino-4-imidazole-carboxylate carboxylase [Lentisphaerae bacterium RIFOXYA12_FULL_48_11]|nr:MAG: 1-(5-phosphoribosyl)-5-amino-4-imidazole-carboxylate carboxylase [Lentisphaerae bacterium RIFOXYA12_FULL_48_11]
MKHSHNQKEHDLGFARIDLDRHRRCGVPEVIYCQGKTAPQILSIMKAMQKNGHDVLATRASREQFAVVKKGIPKAVYHEIARAITLDVNKPTKSRGLVAVICAGTSDLPVAEEAALTAERMGANVVKVYDVGVAGLHRLVNRLDDLKSARAVIVVAGMEGALPSVVGGLINKPIIAVPTSIGYGTSMQGIAALLAMLNSCVPGISVVNIDNGFGAGTAAAMINRVAEEN